MPISTRCTVTLLLFFILPFSTVHAQSTINDNTATATSSERTLTAGAVASPDRYGAEVAAAILQQGGNAVDAAIATAFALAVTYPEAGNIGGGGFMTLWFNGKAYFLDYREMAPAKAHRDMYLNNEGDVIDDLSLIGHLASGVPGTVMGLWQAHQLFATKPWADLIAPAIKLAQEGYMVPEKTYLYDSNVLNRFAGKTNFADYFAAMQPGKIFKQPQLATTLARIAQYGPADFYKGETAKLILAEMARGNGLIDADDLRNYKAVWRNPLIRNWRDMQLITVAPPSSGGIALNQLLALKEFNAEHFTDVSHNSAQYVHLIAEIEKRVFADRADYLGDPDFTDVPQRQLLEPAYLQKRASEINPKAISDTASVKPGLESEQTTHFSVVDKAGNAVSNTYTLNLDYGSGVVVSGAGFLLNNEMDDFSAKAGVPNAFGVVGSDANAIAPGKRMLSSMTPTILLKDEKLELVIGTPGGSTIFTSIFQVINNLYDFKMTPEEAVAAPRFHHQLLPQDQIRTEPYAALAAPVLPQLQQLGYQVHMPDWNLGDIQLIKIEARKPIPAADPRGRGVALVVE
ncbi:gamma-glutamyltranspeptidase [Alishewanella longhuensis]|uniref:Glutathione hydrolase proenzyme n=1 Tax=Alishewanella longhuensis TaxID=1091037 RepID=A0ABQ3L2W3_9ALTE|nr:gamma-glutamyltransferase [Alishewanella longhuensis]GHG77203.1 gamma-glutamyltranspeptidase [Alishewanella longhuensis]